MSAPNILYYARMEYDQTSKKTPKYVVTAQAGYYPMEALRGRDGRISMYLLEKLKEGEHVPDMRLQAKDSLNFTGLKTRFTPEGKMSNFAYGEPLQTKTYSSKGKLNPFYECRGDGFLFIVHYDTPITRTDGSKIPNCIELLVLEGARVTIAGYCKQLEMGGFDEALKDLREQASRQVF